jgi:DNA mismatch endonuclease (patch repair protein)
MAAVGARNTKCESLLCAELRRLGLSFKRNVRSLPGKPDVVFSQQRVVVFCDGDFWHGRNWALRKARLERGSNADYWVKKISANMARDRRQRADLKRVGWIVIRVWETQVLKNAERVAQRILAVVMSPP